MTFYRLLTIEEKEIANRLVIEFEKSNHHIPILYKLFITNFKTGVEYEFWGGYVDKYFRVTPLYTIDVLIGENANISYTFLKTIEEIINDLDYENMIQDYQMIKIGDIAVGGGLYLGIGQINYDKIFKFEWDRDKAPICIFSNIFDLFKAMMFIPNKVMPTSLMKAPMDKFYLIPNCEWEIKKESLYEIINKRKDIKQLNFHVIYELNTPIIKLQKSPYNIKINDEVKNELIYISQINLFSILTDICLELETNPYQYPIIQDDIRFITNPFLPFLLFYVIIDDDVFIFKLINRMLLIK